MKTLRSLAILFCFLLIGLSGCKQRTALPNEISAAEAQRIAQAGASDARNVRFENRFELIGASTHFTMNGLVLETAWKSLKKQRRDCLVAVHVTDKDGKILAQADYRQAEGEVPEGIFWKESATLPYADFAGAGAIGIGLLENINKWLVADHGPRDTEDSRLLLPLPGELPSFAKGIPYAGFLEGANCTEIAGWVWNKTQPDAVVKVEICDGSDVIQTVEASGLREDLAKNGIGTGKYGFRIPTPSQFKDGKLHTVRVRISGIGLELQKSPVSLTCKGG